LVRAGNSQRVPAFCRRRATLRTYPAMPDRSACAWFRNHHRICILLLTTSVLLSSCQHCVASERRNSPTVKLVQKVRPAIVNIHGQKTLSPGDENYRRGESQNVNGMGTGVII